MTPAPAVRLSTVLLIGLLAFVFQPPPAQAHPSTTSSADVLTKKKPPKRHHGKKAKKAKKHAQKQAPAQTGRPNIVVVMMDDMRADELQYAPNVNSLITARGLTFANSFSPYPLCCPARASFLTGQYAHNHGVLATEAPWGFGSFDDSATLAGNLQAAGYNTAMVGKYLNGYGWMPSKVTGGPSRRYKPPGWTDWMASLDTNALELPTLGKGGTYNYLRFKQNINGRVKMAKRPKYSADVIAGQVNGLVNKYKKRPKPFFMWITPVNPHVGAPADPGDPGPFVKSNGVVQLFLTPFVPPRYRGMFNAQIPHSPGIPASGVAEEDITDKPMWMQIWLPNTPYENAAMTEVERQRAVSIYAWDVQFGRIVRALRKAGRYDNTVFIFTSDNGYYLGEHRQPQGKINGHEPSIRVPLVIAGPGVAHGTTFAPASTIDLPSTILEIAGAPPRGGTDGVSLLPELGDPNRGWVRPIVIEGRMYGMPASPEVPDGLSSSGIRTGRFKYIRYSTGEEEFYDLLNDPNELESLHNDPAYADIKAQLITVWQNRRACAGDPCRAPLPPELQLDTNDLRALDANARAQYALYYQN
ncbi:MAG: sulfatase [Nocardioidaceae bacterium]|nr:sulfatase [Nocardioidaceae bacterium]